MDHNFYKHYPYICLSLEIIIVNLLLCIHILFLDNLFFLFVNIYQYRNVHYSLCIIIKKSLCVVIYQNLFFRFYRVGILFVKAYELTNINIC